MNVTFVKLFPPLGKVMRANWLTELAALCGESKFGGSSPRVDWSPLKANEYPPPPAIGA